MRFWCFVVTIIVLIATPCFAQKKVGQNPEYKPLLTKVEMKAIDGILAALPNEQQIVKIAGEIGLKDTYLVKVEPTFQGNQKVSDGYEYYLYLRKPLLPLPPSVVDSVDGQLYSMAVAARYVSQDEKRLHCLVYGKSKETGNWRVIADRDGHGYLDIEVDSTIQNTRQSLRRRMIDMAIYRLIAKWEESFKSAVSTRDEVAISACFAKPARADIAPLIKLTMVGPCMIQSRESSAQGGYVDFSLFRNDRVIKVISINLAIYEGEVKGIKAKLANDP